MADDRLAKVRDVLPAVGRVHYLNTGTCGPLPASTGAVMRAAAEREVEEGRIGMAGFAALFEQLAGVRASYERIIGAPPGSVAATHHTTDGMNVAIAGQRWRPGDEVLATDIEHIGGLAPLYLIAERYGVAVRRVDVGDGSGDLAGRIASAIGPRTRLLSISHVSYSTGATLPIAEIAAACHRHGVLVAVDAAQSAGAIPVDVGALDCDFYAMPGQKWLCGPEGTGAVYVRPDLIPATLPPVLGGFGLAGHDDAALTYRIQPDARRFEVGSVYRPGIAGLLESLRWRLEDVGLDWGYERIRSGARHLRELLADVPGVKIHTPVGQEAGLLVFSLAGHTPEEVVAACESRNVVIRTIARPAAVRVSTGFYNDDADLVALRDAVAGMRG
ncbi:MAG TPA: aminotransferase class V-fold PLP-dependent enzyme [Bacillota bacterium]|nr:aminotransferase class V-fold PLP-dependent enzyme [Bacillota bacterium]